MCFSHQQKTGTGRYSAGVGIVYRIANAVLGILKIKDEAGTLREYATDGRACFCLTSMYQAFSVLQACSEEGASREMPSFSGDMSFS